MHGAAAAAAAAWRREDSRGAGGQAAHTVPKGQTPRERTLMCVTVGLLLGGDDNPYCWSHGCRQLALPNLCWQGRAPRDVPVQFEKATGQEKEPCSGHRQNAAMVLGTFPSQCRSLGSTTAHNLPCTLAAGCPAGPCLPPALDPPHQPCHSIRQLQILVLPLHTLLFWTDKH